MRRCLCCGLNRQQAGVRVLQICAGCELAKYCSRQCQQQHWPEHQQLCSQVQQSKRRSAAAQAEIAAAQAEIAGAAAQYKAAKKALKRMHRMKDQQQQ